jgi:hypothetical protein
MRPRVAGGFDDAGTVFAQCEAVAFTHQYVDAGNPVGIGARADDAAAGAGLQREIAAGVIGVMVGVEDVVKFPASRRKFPLDGRCIRAVDGGGEARVRIVQQIAVVVVQTGELMDLQCGHLRLTFPGAAASVRPGCRGGCGNRAARR